MLVNMRSLLTVDQVAKVLNISNQTGRKLVRNGEIQAVKIGRTYRITEEALNKFIIDKQGR